MCIISIIDLDLKQLGMNQKNMLLEVLEFPEPGFLLLGVLRYGSGLWWPLQVEIFPNAAKSGTTTSRCTGSILPELDPEPIHTIAWLLFCSCWLGTNRVLGLRLLREFLGQPNFVFLERVLITR